LLVNTDWEPKMPSAPLDRVDRRILELLQRDGRLTNVELAAKIALSPSPCLRRVRALEEGGVIREYVALVDPARVGLGLLAFANVKLEKGGRLPIDDFLSAVQGWPEVVACYAMTGDTDYLLRVHVEDLEHYSRFMMNRLLKQPGVIDVRSNFVLERIKDTTALPLGHLG
jgi:Lrp/AsnC family leucine-responsive transcriptional regulator